MKALLDPIKTESLKEVFISRFEELILSGKLSIGQVLPSERELALQLGVSRPVVHEGLVELAHKDLVSLKPRVGAVVNDYRRKGSLTLLTSLLSYHDGLIEPKLLDSMLDVRLLFEIEMARLAALNRTSEHQDAFAEIIEREDQLSAGETEKIAQLDFQFHHLLALASGNLVYPMLINSFKPVYTNLTGVFFTDETIVPLVFKLHRKLTDAISQKDADQAVKVMRNLLDHGARHLKSLIDS